MPNRTYNGDSSSSIVMGSIVNKVSVNLTPFRVVRIRYNTDFYGSGTVHYDMGTPSCYILRTNKTSIKSLFFQGWPNPFDIDVSDVNEHAFIKLQGGSGPSYNGGSYGGNMHITQIEFIA